jgi:CRISPR-associated endoribonuclease Cas6
MEIYPLIIEFKAVTPTDFQQYPGITLRGGLGMSMKRALCVMGKGKDNCIDCILAGTCAYARVFESINSNQEKVMQKASHYPHPFVMTPLFEGPVNFSRGDIFRLSFNLFGDSVKYLPHIVHSFVKFGENGTGKSRGNFKIFRISQGNDDTSLYSESGEIDLTRLKPLDVYTPDYTDKVEIEFKTPCRINSKGKALKNAEFSEIIKNIVRRKNLLGGLYCSSPFHGERNNAIIAAASEISKVSENLKWQQVSRYSKRQDNRMSLEGFTGTAVFQGDMAPFQELLKSAEYINIGKNSSFGFGAVKVSFI